jgi:hypothetical protein
MHDIGVLKSDFNSQGLYEQFKIETVPEITKEGQLVFYGSSSHDITHAMVVLDVWGKGMAVLVGARGGNKFTTTPKQAFADNAYVDTVLSNYWPSHQIVIVDPWWR